MNQPRRALGSSGSRVGIVLVAIVVGVALIGPFVAPYSPTALVGRPFADRSTRARLGTDFLGHDLLSRVLTGGWKLLLVATFATVLAYLIGGALGLFAAFAGRRADGLVMRTMDAFLAFPPLLLILLLAAGLGRGWSSVIVGVVALHVPSLARVLRSSAQEVITHGYVEAAVARGDKTRSILVRQILPNVAHVVAADGGPRLTGSIYAIAGLNFLGVGATSGQADWAVMINENRVGLTNSPLTVLVPAALIGILTIVVNLVADAIGDRKAPT